MNKSFADALQELQTIADFIRFGITEASKHDLFFGHGNSKIQDDIYALVLDSLSLPEEMFPVLFQARLTTAEKQTLLERFSARILERIPVPYITNTAHFCGLSFYVDDRVLIPRSPIAELIGKQFFPWVDPDKVEHILDLCTGSGCLAIACNYAFPDAEVDAVDLSPDALEVAAINAEQHGLQEPALRLIQSDCWADLPVKRYDIIISNPPYVGDEEMAGLPKEYLHEPDMALRAPNDGLYLVEKILKEAHKYLTNEGILVVEVGNTEEALSEAYPELPFTWLEFEHGGHGVFLLTGEQLRSYHKAG